MTIAYRRRKKRIKAEKRKFEWTSHIEPKNFILLQTNWQNEVDDPPIGTLAQMMGAKNDHG